MAHVQCGWVNTFSLRRDPLRVRTHLMRPHCWLNLYATMLCDKYLGLVMFKTANTIVSHSTRTFFSVVTPVILGPGCCTPSTYLLHLLWMRTAVSLVVLHSSSCCVLQTSLIVTESLCLSLSSLNSWMSSWILSSLVSERVFFWTAGAQHPMFSSRGTQDDSFTSYNQTVPHRTKRVSFERRCVLSRTMVVSWFQLSLWC